MDALVAWGDLGSITQRVSEHRAAGADHVALSVLTTRSAAAPVVEWRELAELVKL